MSDIITRPQNEQELYNLRHAKARNVVERIFGVLKKRWDILNKPPEYDINIQAKIPAGLAAVHNFILDHDETDLAHYLPDDTVDIRRDGYRDEDLGERGNGVIQ